MAAERGLGSWLSFDSAFVSLNMAKYTRRMARPSEPLLRVDQLHRPRGERD